MLNVGIFLKVIFCMANTEEKPEIYNYYNNYKMLVLVFVICISFLCFISYFFQKVESIRFLKNTVDQSFVILFFLFLLKLGSLGPVDQQFSLVSAEYSFFCIHIIIFHLNTLLKVIWFNPFFFRILSS